jgi:hypothetical protein
VVDRSETARGAYASAWSARFVLGAHTGVVPPSFDGLSKMKAQPMPAPGAPTLSSKSPKRIWSAKPNPHQPHGHAPWAADSPRSPRYPLPCRTHFETQRDIRTREAKLSHSQVEKTTRVFREIWCGRLWRQVGLFCVVGGAFQRLLAQIKQKL